ncbi:helix-turn-helix domain-containing protein [Clostridium sp. ZS2-4]|uniref:helix-turn-helix domain-containing protein n=1 Tax=Clostridium sp. ZS2-4 TaxID=2987703 RepID=UPI00227C471B|nr:helix-turn-helix domain-containing protein [Clostridium sp. ZS2-4]MCY6355066.1 helix-turn-helix domain-containing protein [Clostridium sp. ZS2-4]
MDRTKLKQILNKIKVVIDTEITVMDETGYIIESTNSEKVGDYDLNFRNINFKNKLCQIGDYIYYFFTSADGKKNVFSLKGLSKESKKFAEIIGIFFNQDFYDISQSELLRNLLLNGLTQIEENSLDTFQEKNFISPQTKMRALVIDVDKNMMKELENLISHIYPDHLHCKINNNSFCFIEKCSKVDDQYYFQIYDAIYSELYYEPKIGVGTTVSTLKDLSVSYKKAVESIKLGKLFLSDKNIYCFRDFGLPRLIDNMDINSLEELCEDMNYKNVYKVLSDSELVLTSEKFFESNLNISLTAKKLFIHRNTLIYRLTKIFKISGYDLRVLEDSINFKVAMFIHNYMKNKGNKGRENKGTVL